LPENPREVKVCHKDGLKYEFEDFKQFIQLENPKEKIKSTNKPTEFIEGTPSPFDVSV